MTVKHVPHGLKFIRQKPLRIRHDPKPGWHVCPLPSPAAYIQTDSSRIRFSHKMQSVWLPVHRVGSSTSSITGFLLCVVSCVRSTAPSPPFRHDFLTAKCSTTGMYQTPTLQKRHQFPVCTVPVQVIPGDIQYLSLRLPGSSLVPRKTHPP